MTTMDESFRFIEEELQRDYWFSIYINSFVSEFDPNSSYLDPESRERFDVDMSGNYAGIGARLQKKVDKIEITEVISGGPAWRENKLTSGDIILKVRQENEIEPVSILGMRLADAVKLIKGEKGTKVFLTIKKVDGTVNEVSIKRDIVLLEETYIKSSLIQNNGRNYGLINIPKFYIDFDNQNNKDAAKDLREEIKRLKNMNIKGLLVDLRKNRMNSIKETESTNYTNLEKIVKEVNDAKKIFKKYKWPIIDVSRKSVEETAASVIKIYEIAKNNG